MGYKVDLSVREAKTILSVVFSGIGFVLILISIALFNKGKYIELIGLLTITISFYSIVLFVLLKINRINLISFDEENIFIENKGLKYSRSDIKEIRYFFLSASYIVFMDSKKFYFLASKDESSFI